MVKGKSHIEEATVVSVDEGERPLVLNDGRGQGTHAKLTVSHHVLHDAHTPTMLVNATLTSRKTKVTQLGCGCTGGEPRSASSCGLNCAASASCIINNNMPP